MSVAEVLKARVSVRVFQSTPIPKATVYSLLDAARYAPSGGNIQPWKVIVVSGRARDDVSNLAMQRTMQNPAGEAGAHPIYPEKLTEPYRSRRFKIGEDMYALLGIGRENRPARLEWVARNYSFFGAPVGLFFVIDRSMGHGQWAHLGMFMQSFALVAQERGLSTCMQEAWAMVRLVARALRAPRSGDDLLRHGARLRGSGRGRQFVTFGSGVGRRLHDVRRIYRLAGARRSLFPFRASGE